MVKQITEEQKNLYNRIQTIEEQINDLVKERQDLIKQFPNGFKSLCEIWIDVFKLQLEKFTTIYQVFSDYTLRYSPKYKCYICHWNVDESKVYDNQWKALNEFEETVKYDYVLFETNEILYKEN